MLSGTEATGVYSLALNNLTGCNCRVYNFFLPRAALVFSFVFSPPTFIPFFCISYEMVPDLFQELRNLATFVIGFPALESQ